MTFPEDSSNTSSSDEDEEASPWGLDLDAQMSSVVCFLGVFWLSRFFETWAWTLNQSIHGFFKFLPKIHQHTDTPHPSTEQNIKTALSFEQICSYFPHGHQVELARRRAAARKAKLKAREKAPVVEGKWEKEEDFFTGQEHIPIMNKGEDSHVFFRGTHWQENEGVKNSFEMRCNSILKEI